MTEQWYKAYASGVDIYEAFGAAGDQDQAVLRRVLELVPFAGKTVLEIGCGPGDDAEVIGPATSTYLALDISPAMVAAARQRCATVPNVALIQADAQAIPLPDESVDIVYGAWAIGAIWPPEDRDRAMVEIHRVVKRDGEIWAVETHWDSPFMEMRGKAEQEWDEQTWHWYVALGFSMIEIIDYAFDFPTLAEARRVLGYIFEKKALRYLEQHPTPRIEHRAIILHKQLGDSGV